MSIGKSFKWARKELRLSQKSMASALGCSRESIINWEREVTPPDFRVVKKLAELLKIKPSKLVARGE